MVKHSYEAPKLVNYGPIADRTLQTPGRAVKGRGYCISHLDKFVELSGHSYESIGFHGRGKHHGYHHDDDD
jgi:hypothetical protein